MNIFHFSRSPGDFSIYDISACYEDSHKLHLMVGISLHQDLQLSMHLHLYLSLHLDLYLSLHLDVYLSLHLTVSIPLHLDLKLTWTFISPSTLGCPNIPKW